MWEFGKQWFGVRVAMGEELSKGGGSHHVDCVGWNVCVCVQSTRGSHSRLAIDGRDGEVWVPEWLVVDGLEVGLGS